jgi:hydroxymethylglutaryl-CoA lyase
VTAVERPLSERTLWTPRPLPVPAAGLPDRVRVLEVGPRDGLQAEAEILPTAVKVEFCRRLLAAGVGSLEVTSFVSPRWIPQLADAEPVLAELGDVDSARIVTLVPNLRGLERAIAAGVRHVSVVASSTASFAAANLNSTVETALERATEVTAAATSAGLTVRGYLSMCFGDPWEGAVDPARAADLAAALFSAGCNSVALSDTIGVGTPGQVADLISRSGTAGVPVSALAMHFHDTYAQALANVHEALRHGVVEFDASAGGLGRCPYAPGAAGNLATEDLVWMLHGLGIQTGIDLNALVMTSRWMSATLGRPVPSRVVRALSALEPALSHPSPPAP